MIITDAQKPFAAAEPCDLTDFFLGEIQDVLNQPRLLFLHLHDDLDTAGIQDAFAIFAVIRLGSKGSDNSRNTTQPKSSTVNASASSNIETPLDNADAPKFCPGVYTASILLDGNPVDIQVTVDSSNINSIELVNLSESITTMYPKLATSFDEVASKVMEAGTTNITYDSANRYTYSVFIEAISAALKKAAP